MRQFDDRGLPMSVALSTEEAMESEPVVESKSNIENKSDIESEPTVELEGFEAIVRDLKELPSQLPQCKVRLGSSSESIISKVSICRRPSEFPRPSTLWTGM